MSELLSPTRVGVDELVARLRALPASAFDETETIVALLTQMPVSEASLAPYLTWDRQHYTRNLIDKTELYELLAICWEVGQGSSVHNHRGQNCWMAAPMGNLLVENFHVGFEDIEAGKCQMAASNTVELTAANPCAVDPREPVHRVVNPGTQISGRSRCTSIRVPLIVVSSIRPSRERAEIYGCATYSFWKASTQYLITST